ncbi:MAG: hypothetical protein F6K47_20760 [Symploca sp. SIO2E6]|nr:hypothetical protein [Symploca sp. SIO2E6]
MGKTTKTQITHCCRDFWINRSVRRSSFRSRRLQVARPVDVVPIICVPSSDHETQRECTLINIGDAIAQQKSFTSS